MNQRIPLPRLAPEVGLFLGGTVLQVLLTQRTAPALCRATGLEPLASWMILSVPTLFGPLIAGAVWLLCRESRPPSWRDRLWLRAPSSRDWRWVAAGAGVIVVGSAALFLLTRLLGLDAASPFTRGVEPLTADRWWLVVIWLVFWPVNILGEEFVWRAVLLPRMTAVVGGWAWVLNAALWGVFHIGFGLGNNLVLLPTLLTVPWVVQRTRNVWLGVALHALLSLPGFIAIALGKV